MWEADAARKGTAGAAEPRLPCPQEGFRGNCFPKISLLSETPPVQPPRLRSGGSRLREGSRGRDKGARGWRSARGSLGVLLLPLFPLWSPKSAALLWGKPRPGCGAGASCQTPEKSWDLKFEIKSSSVQKNFCFLFFFSFF